MSIPFGIFVPQGWRMDLVEIKDPVQQYEAMSRAARAAEQAGFDSIWLYDHFHTVPTPEIETTFEAWTATAALARDTSRIKLGQMVTCNGYRNPAYLAKVASCIDVISNGRLLCGLGAGWYEHEWRAYGYGFPETPERLKMLRESVQIILSMWTEEYAEFKGKYYSIDKAINFKKKAAALDTNDAALQAEVSKGILYQNGFHNYLEMNWQPAVQYLSSLVGVDNGYANGFARFGPDVFHGAIG